MNLDLDGAGTLTFDRIYLKYRDVCSGVVNNTADEQSIMLRS